MALPDGAPARPALRASGIVFGIPQTDGSRFAMLKRSRTTVRVRDDLRLAHYDLTLDPGCASMTLRFPSILLACGPGGLHGPEPRLVDVRNRAVTTFPPASGHSLEAPRGWAADYDSFYGLGRYWLMGSAQTPGPHPGHYAVFLNRRTAERRLIADGPALNPDSVRLAPLRPLRRCRDRAGRGFTAQYPPFGLHLAGRARRTLLLNRCGGTTRFVARSPSFGGFSLHGGIVSWADSQRAGVYVLSSRRRWTWSFPGYDSRRTGYSVEVAHTRRRLYVALGIPEPPTPRFRLFTVDLARQNNDRHRESGPA